MKNDEPVNVVLGSRVGEHLAAFRVISESTFEQRAAARKLFRDYMKTQVDNPAFQPLDDAGILCMFLEEFSEFAMFIMRDNQETQARSGMPVQKAGTA